MVSCCLVGCMLVVLNFRGCRKVVDELSRLRWGFLLGTMIPLGVQGP